MRLSADRINRKSPYWVIQLDEMTFRFVTRNGIIYRVGFYQDQYSMEIASIADLNGTQVSHLRGPETGVITLDKIRKK